MWSNEKLNEYINKRIEENKHLEYKGAKALDNADSRKKEISKDVSSFANSDGGIIIYGIKEFDDVNKKHLPERIDPVNRLEFSKEWIENVITGNISPIIDDLSIIPIVIDEVNSLVVYVIEIKKSNTAHQASDYRYYKRHNFKAVPMEDWEVKDVANRGNKPIIEIILAANIYSDILSRINGSRYEIQLILKNKGNIGAQQLECYVEFDEKYSKYIMKDPMPLKGKGIIQFPFNNRIEHKIKIGNGEVPVSIYYQPLLPHVWREFGKIKVRKDLFDKDCIIKCHVSTEYGMTSKEFKLQEMLRKASIT